MSRPILKGVDFGVEDLNTYAPQIPHNFCIWLTLSIGPEDTEGSHLFQVGVCTITWLAHQLSIEGACVLKHMILVERFDFDLIKEMVHKIVKSAERPSWNESVQVLCRYFAWEFDGYRA